MIKTLKRFLPKDPILFHDTLNPKLALLLKIFGKDRRPPAHVLGFEILHYLNSGVLFSSIG